MNSVNLNTLNNKEEYIEYCVIAIFGIMEFIFFIFYVFLFLYLIDILVEISILIYYAHANLFTKYRFRGSIYFI